MKLDSIYFALIASLLLFVGCKKDSVSDKCPIVKQVRYLNEQMMETFSYTYENSMLKTKEQVSYLSPTNSTIFTAKYEYNGSKMTKVLTIFNGSPIGDFRYSYNVEGKLINVEPYNSSGQAVSTSSFVYNEGRLIKISLRKANGYFGNEYDAHFTYTGGNVTGLRLKPFPTGEETVSEFGYTGHKNTHFSDQVYGFSTDDIYQLPIYLSENLVASQKFTSGSTTTNKNYSYEFMKNGRVSKVIENAIGTASPIRVVTENTCSCK